MTLKEALDALVAPRAYPLSYRLDVALDELEPIVEGARLSLHHGTGHVLARVARIGDRWAQLRLAEPVVAARGDRVVLRRVVAVAVVREGDVAGVDDDEEDFS